MRGLSVKLSHSKNTLAALYAKRLFVWNIDLSKEVAADLIDGFIPTMMSTSEDGRYLAVADKNGAVLLFKVNTGSLEEDKVKSFIVQGHGSEITNLSVCSKVGVLLSVNKVSLFL